MNLDADLVQLETADLVRRANDAELAYQFKHALTQDAAYALLLKGDRARLHRRVAGAYETLYADRLNEFAARLAQHYAQADEDAKTLEYATRAGDVAARVYASVEAIANYSLAIAAAERLASTGPEQLIDLFSKRGRVLELAGRHAEAMQSYERLAGLADERRDGALRLASLMLRATLYNVHTSLHDSARGDALAQQALSLAHELGDSAAEARILWSLLLASQWGAGGSQRAIEYGERALTLARKLDLREQLAYTLSDLAYPYLYLGQLSHARALREEAHPIWCELDVKPMMTDNLAGLASIYRATGEFAKAQSAAEESFRISDAIGNTWGQSYSQGMLGIIYADLGEFDEAAAMLEASIQKGEAVGALGPIVVSAVALADLYSFVGESTRALQWARYAGEKAEAQLPEWAIWTSATLARVYRLTGDLTAMEEAIKPLPDSLVEIYEKLPPEGAAPTILAKAECALAQRDYARASAIAEELVQLARQRGMLGNMVDAQYLQSEILRARGDVQAAAQELVNARREAENLNARRSLFAISSSLAQLERAHPDLIDQSASTQAHETWEYLLAHTTRVDLREPLIASSAVSSIRQRVPLRNEP